MHIPITKGDRSPTAPKFARADAPYLSGEFGHAHGVVHFLVDTGADSTMLNGALVPKCNEIWPTGAESKSHGIGGDWPTRNFKDWSLIALTDTGDEVKLELPAVSIGAPYVLHRRQGEPRVFFNEPGAGMGRVVKNENPNLLGRDFFVKNRLRLVWDPEGTSRIEFIVPPTPPAPGKPTS